MAGHGTQSPRALAVLTVTLPDPSASLKYLWGARARTGARVCERAVEGVGGSAVAGGKELRARS